MSQLNFEKNSVFFISQFYIAGTWQVSFEKKSTWWMTQAMILSRKNFSSCRNRAHRLMQAEPLEKCWYKENFKCHCFRRGQPIAPLDSKSFRRYRMRWTLYHNCNKKCVRKSLEFFFFFFRYMNASHCKIVQQFECCAEEYTQYKTRVAWCGTTEYPVSLPSICFIEMCFFGMQAVSGRISRQKIMRS